MSCAPETSARTLTLQSSFSTLTGYKKTKARPTIVPEQLWKSCLNTGAKEAPKPARQARQVGLMPEAHLTRLSPKAGCNCPAQVFVRHIHAGACEVCGQGAEGARQPPCRPSRPAGRGPCSPGPATSVGLACCARPPACWSAGCRRPRAPASPAGGWGSDSQGLAGLGDGHIGAGGTVRQRTRYSAIACVLNCVGRQAHPRDSPVAVGGYAVAAATAEEHLRRYTTTCSAASKLHFVAVDAGSSRRAPEKDVEAVAGGADSKAPTI